VALKTGSKWKNGSHSLKWLKMGRSRKNWQKITQKKNSMVKMVQNALIELSKNFIYTNF